MVIYNVTIKVEHAIAAAWLQWMKEEHLSEVMATGCFQQYRMARLLEIDDEEGLTYSVQYEAANREDYDRYLQQYAAVLRQRSFDKWGGGFIAFRSLMEVV